MTQKQRRNWMKRADDAFSLFIKERDERCLNCESTYYLQCAHIRSRSYKAIRVDPDNAVALCRSCHMRFGNRPFEWEEWVEERWPGRWDALKTKGLTYASVDWKSQAEFWEAKTPAQR